MASPDLLPAVDTCTGVALPVNPFVSNRYHFGMLLGVADLETDQGYHRGKTWLHNSWLHGHGTVWGLGVALEAGTDELAVAPGLAIDGRGRELVVAERLCVDLGLWFESHWPPDAPVVDDGAGGVVFDVRVNLYARQCLDRPVPAIADTCSPDPAGSTAYSRAVEQAVPVLELPTAAGVDDAGAYPRIHQLLGLAEATDALVQSALTELAAATADDRPGLLRAWLRRLLAADAIDRAPEAGLGDVFAAADPAGVALADVHVHLAPEGTGWRVVADGTDPTTVDNLIRPVVAPTGLLQTLLGPALLKPSTIPS